MCARARASVPVNTAINREINRENNNGKGPKDVRRVIAIGVTWSLQGRRVGGRNVLPVHFLPTNNLDTELNTA